MKIPTLHSGTLQVLDSTQDKVSYIIRHSLTNPGFTSDLIEDHLVSFRKIEADHEGRIEEMMADYKNRLETAIENVIGSAVEVILEIEQLDMTNKDNTLNNPNAGSDVHGDKYSLTVTVVDSTTQVPIVSYGKITVDGTDINIEFDSAGEPV